MPNKHRSPVVSRARHQRLARVLTTVGLLWALLDPLGAPAHGAASQSFAVAFAPRTDVTAGLEPSSVALGDLNGDGHMDMVVANGGWPTFEPDALPGTISVHLGDGAGGFGAATHIEVGAETYSVALNDLNNDTHLDLIVTAGTGNLRTLLGDGAGGFGEAIIDYSGSSLAAGSVAVGDFNGDGIRDIAVPTYSSGAVVVWSQGNFAYYLVDSPGSLTSPRAVASGDLDGDGDLDLVTVNTDSTLSVLPGNGDGSFATAVKYPVGLGPTALVAADFDSDGDLDLATMNAGSNTVSVLAGNGDGTFEARTDFAAGAGARAIADADLNGDQIPDLVTANFDADTVSVLVGDGSGAFAAPSDFATGPGPAAVALGDLDGDTVPDLAVAAATSDAPPPPPFGGPKPAVGSVSVLLNRSIPDVPGPPTILRNATAGSGQATLSWLAPASDGGSPLTGYVVTPYVGYIAKPSTTFNSTATTQTVTGLMNGTTYRFKVAALNAAGVGATSMVTNPVTPIATAPSAPTIIRDATAGNQSATVNWMVPTSDGGSPITGYVITPFVGYIARPPTTFDSDATTQTVTGLTNGTEYRFRVQAINAIGASDYSKVTNPVTPTAA